MTLAVPLAGFEGPSPLELLTLLLGLGVTIGFWAAVILVIVKLVRSRSGSMGPVTSAVQVLEERFARGEISREEYFERRAVLSGAPSAAPKP